MFSDQGSLVSPSLTTDETFAVLASYARMPLSTIEYEEQAAVAAAESAQADILANPVRFLVYMS